MKTLPIEFPKDFLDEIERIRKQLGDYPGLSIVLGGSAAWKLLSGVPWEQIKDKDIYFVCGDSSFVPKDVASKVFATLEKPSPLYFSPDGSCAKFAFNKKDYNFRKNYFGVYSNFQVGIDLLSGDRKVIFDPDQPARQERDFERFIQEKIIITYDLDKLVKRFESNEKSLNENEDIKTLAFVLKSYLNPLVIPGTRFSHETAKLLCELYENKKMDKLKERLTGYPYFLHESQIEFVFLSAKVHWMENQEKANNETDVLQTVVLSLGTQIEENQREISALKTQLELRTAEVQRLNRGLWAKNTANERLYAQVSDLERSLLESNDSNEKHKARIQQLESSLRETREQKERQMREHADMTLALGAQYEQNKKEQMSVYEEKQKELLAELKVKTQEIYSLKNKEKTSADSALVQSERIKELERALQKERERNKNLESQMKAQSEKLKKLEEDITDRKKEEAFKQQMKRVVLSSSFVSTNAEVEEMHAFYQKFDENYRKNKNKSESSRSDMLACLRSVISDIQDSELNDKNRKTIERLKACCDDRIQDDDVTARGALYFVHSTTIWLDNFERFFDKDRAKEIREQDIAKVIKHHFVTIQNDFPGMGSAWSILQYFLSLKRYMDAVSIQHLPKGHPLIRSMLPKADMPFNALRYREKCLKYIASNDMLSLSQNEKNDEDLMKKILTLITSSITDLIDPSDALIDQMRGAIYAKNQGQEMQGTTNPINHSSRNGERREVERQVQYDTDEDEQRMYCTII